MIIELKLTKRGEHIVQVILVDEAIPVLVDHVEGLLELLVQQYLQISYNKLPIYYGHLISY